MAGRHLDSMGPTPLGSCCQAAHLMPAAVDVERLFKLRLVVGRVGEMDLARWWNTQGQLGSLGSSVVTRGFPRTHHFAQARAVFAVAAHRCREVYDPPNSVTLWRMPAAVEDELELSAERWREDTATWKPFFEEVEACTADLRAQLQRLRLVSPEHLEYESRLRRSAEQRAVQVPGEFFGSDDDITMLALAFARGEPGNLAVPYQAWEPTS